MKLRKMTKQITLKHILIYTCLLYLWCNSYPIFSNAIFTYDNNQFAPPIANNMPIAPKKIIKIPLKHTTPKEISPLLSALFPNTNFQVQPSSRSIFIKTTKDQIPLIKTTIKKLDTPPKLIKVTVSIISIHYENFNQFDTIFSQLTNQFKINYNFETNKVIAPPQIQTTIQHLLQTGKAKLIASPSLTTLDNQPATIKIGDKIPYVTASYQNTQTTQHVNYMDTGINLTLHPKISAQNEITLTIDAQINSLKVYKQFNNNQYPTLSERHAKTNIRIQNKKTLIIAGLLDEQEKQTQSKVPLLSDIPYLGHLFTTSSSEKTSSDIIFIIQPEIL